MRTYRLIFLVLSLVFLFACPSKQDGALEGTVVPPSAGVMITVTQNGKIQTSVGANMQDGKFRMPLPSGAYDVSVSVQSSPYPMTFPAVLVEPGKTTTLPPISFAQPSGHAVLAGRVLPGGSTTRIALYAEGRERASLNPDGEGKYQFKELSAGTYTIQSVATGYAQDAVEVNLTNDQAMTQNMRLLYVSVISGVDWAAGKVRATGVGMPPATAVNATIKREMARRAALVDAQRNLLNAINQIKTGPDQSLKSLWGEKKYASIVSGFIRGYTVTGERELSGGKIEVDVELPLTGRTGLTQYLSE